MSIEERISTTTLELISDYEFRVKFDFPVDDLILDEPEPLGHSKGPNASRVLTSAIANCLSASLIFCLTKWKIKVTGMKTIAKTSIQRNSSGRWRIHHVDITIYPTYSDPHHERIPRCIDQFEDYCVVTESVRSGIPVNVTIEDPDKA